MLRHVARRAVVTGAPRVHAMASTLRRAAFIARVRAAAASVDATVDLRVADDVRLGAGVRVVFAPWTANELVIAGGCLLDDAVRVQLKGGGVHIGERVEVRRMTLMNVAGRLEIGDDTLVSWGCVLHCSEGIRIGPRVLIAEYSTFADSSHYFTAPDETAWHNVRSTPIEVGGGTWLGAKATLARGAKVGAHCIVASNSLVVGTVPDGSLASGVPAEARPLRLPWSSE
ncbi:MAG: acyltransferase [Actinomycetota bacterium]|nr:acyltransferase [Actinomycetota bacterium]